MDTQIDVQVIKKYVSKKSTRTFKGRSHICSNGDDYCMSTIIALNGNWNTGYKLITLQVESKGTVVVSLWPVDG